MTRRDRSVVSGRGNHGLEQRTLAGLRQVGPSLPAGPLVVGFSGGPDSLALLLILGQIRSLLDRDLLAIHVDHRLRPDSGLDAARAEELAADLGVPLHVERLEPGLAGRHPGVGIEEAARRERYRAGATFVGAVGGSLVTGHHADDQAETVLLHLLRGSGGAGAGGMRAVTSLMVPWWDSSPIRPPTRLTVVRPLLDTRRSEIGDYLATRRPDLRPVEDPTNRSDRYRRNAVRHHLLPEAERIVPGSVEALNRFARIAAEESDLLDVIAGTALIAATDPARRLSRSVLAVQPVAIARRVLRGWLLANAPGLELSLERVEALRELAGGDDSRWSIEVGAGFTVSGDGDLLTVRSSGTSDFPRNR